MMKQANTEPKWQFLTTISGDLQAELIRGLLQSQGVDVLMFQEGAGRSVYHVTIGPLADVELMVPSSQYQVARQVLEKYQAGGFYEETEFLDNPSIPNDEE